MSNQTLNIVPSRDNTVISDKQVAKIEPLFARCNQLAKIYALSPSTVGKYVKEAELSKEFQNIVYRPSPSILIVDINGFKEFLSAREKKSFQKISK